MSVYLKIKLTPLDKFFFGGEVVLGGDDAQDKRQRSYLVKSNLLPQQTTLLGMLREQLLTQNNLLLLPDDPLRNPKKVQDAKDLVNATGFDGNTMNGFGVIEELSSLFIEDAVGTLSQPAPLDDVLGKDNKPLHFSWDASALRPMMVNLNPKHSLKLQFVSNGGSPKPLNDYFAEDSQVGITITNRRKKGQIAQVTDEDEAFFRQTFRRNYDSNFSASLTSSQTTPNKNAHPKTPYSFAFWVKLTDDYLQKKPLVNAQVNLGGERSMFAMKVETLKSPVAFSDLFEQVNYTNAATLDEDYYRIVLMSDTYADWQKLQQDCALVLAQTVSFRYFTTTLGGTSNFYDFKNAGTSGKQQSKLMTLLQRGGVLYVHKNNVSSVESLLTNDAFQQIGYNHFKTL